ncbi:MAG TPA: ABC transporter substrate-binding protein [Methylomirabilota bacterium]
MTSTSRRAFLQKTTIALLAAPVTRAAAAAMAGVFTPRVARAADTFVVGLVLPAEGALATALQQGAALGLDDANALATLFGKPLRLETASASDGAGAGRAARAFARDGALAVVGGSGPGVADALRDAAADGVLVMNVGAADDRLRNERCDRRLFHVAPSVSMAVDALTRWVADQRKLTRWAVEGDGSARATEMDAAVRRAVGRLGGSVVEPAAAEMRMLAGTDDAVRSALARARAEGWAEQAAGIGGDVPLALAPDEAAGIWVMGWHPELERFSARELNARFRRRFNAPLTETSWAAWAALKLVGEAVVRGNATGAAGIVTFLESAPPFDGHKGSALTFRRWDHQLRQPLYVVAARRREDVGGRRGPFAVVVDVPGTDLDNIGTSAADSRCRLSP